MLDNAEIFLIVGLVALTVGLVALIIKIRQLKQCCVISDRDSMTGLYNRDGFMREGKAMLEKSRKSGDSGRVALIVFDIDELGKINTLFGTDVGDSVVMGFASALSEISPEGSLVSRVNTDDFALLTWCDDEQEIKKLSDKLVSALEKHFESSKTLLEQISFFAGVCIYDAQDDIYTLFNKANLCLLMNESRQQITLFTSEMENRMVENELLRTEMLDALESGQFELYYQPKVSFRTEEMLGVEALIRWHHPTKGFIPPSEFIPLAEKSGIITKIDEWGLMTACRQCKAWQDEGLPPVKISVNMSQAQFYRTDVYTSITKVLEQTGLEPKYLEIEVTETMAMQDIERTVNVLGKIRGLGVSISMDDFGSGYSSLSSLKTIPLDILKIDRSLVCDIDENDVSKQITGAIVDLGKAMKLIVLAEGVETEKQIDYLRKIGCDLAQGYYYSKPRPAKEIEKLLIMPVPQAVNAAE